MFRTAIVALFCLSPAIAAAQTPVDWHMRVSVLDPGDKVNIRTLAGESIHGRVVRVDADSITITRKGVETLVAASRVDRLGPPDRNWNGTGIGFAVGFAAGAVLLIATPSDIDYTAGQLLAIGGIGGLYGAAFGAVIDSRIRGMRPIFQRNDGVRVDIAPAVTSGQRGIAVRVCF
jgi:hypothetical protein